MTTPSEWAVRSYGTLSSRTVVAHGIGVAVTSTVSTGVALAFGAAGVVAGLAARRLLCRLRRGAFVRPGWCEAAVGALWGMVGWRWTQGALPFWWLPVPVLLTWLAVPLTVTDLRYRRLPDALTLAAYPATALALTTSAALGGGWRLLTGAAVGATVLLTSHAAVHWAFPGAIGGGDVKLSGSLGAALGALGLPSVALATVLAAMVTVLLRVVSPRRVTRGWSDGIPHGPGLLTATCLVVVLVS